MRDEVCDGRDYRSVRFGRKALEVAVGGWPHAVDDVVAGCMGSVRQRVVAWRPAILTTAGDVPAMTDLKRLSKVLEIVPRLY